MARSHDPPPDVPAGSPYRTGPAAEATAPPEEGTGLVGELIRQFADSLAFYCELVQNAIDAGTESVHVRLLWEGYEGAAEGTLHVSVRDEGEGMTRDTLEDKLVVLFRSGKEGQTDKIGKFGVGFVSVLALRPDVVVVHTTASENECWTLHLYQDQSYELFERPGESSRGTTVTLRLPLAREKVEDFVQRSVQALKRWCRHATVPIWLAAHVQGIEEPVLETRIDEPLGLDPMAVPIQVSVSAGSTVGVVGVPLDGTPYGGFFNSGLTLYETTSHLLGSALVFKVQDPHLEHTLSRDNVRRDRAYQRVLGVILEAVAGPLRDAALQALATAASTEGAAPSYGRLIKAVMLAELPLPEGRVPYPVVHRGQGPGYLLGADLGDDTVYGAWGASEITEALARERFPVIALDRVGAPNADALVAEALRHYNRILLVDAHRALTSVAPVQPSPSDLLLLEKLDGWLDEVFHPPSELRLVRLTGAQESSLLVAGRSRGGLLLDNREAEKDPFRLGRRLPLLLSASHELVRAARERAKTEPTMAAALLARAILFAYEKLTERRDRRLTRLAMTRVLEGAT